jgi:uncharacterized phage-associated protein
MPAPYSPRSVANALLQRAFNARNPITQLKLQKLVYLCHGFYLAFKDVPLINEPFEAWDFGPVCRSIYQEFREFGRRPISRLAMEFDWDDEGELPAPEPDDEDALQVINYVYDAYSKWSAYQLSELSHKDGWAWKRTRDEDQFDLKNLDIDNEQIKTDFRPYLVLPDETEETIASL